MVDITNGEIEIPFEVFKFVEEELEKKKPIKYLISKATYDCISKNGYVLVECNYQIRLFDIVDNDGENKNKSDKTSSTDSGSGSSSSSNKKESIQLISQIATILESKIKFKNNNEDSWSENNHDATILTSSPYYYLHVGQVGTYDVKLILSVPYLTIKEAGMDLTIPSCSNNSVSFSVPHVNANIKIFNSFIDTKSLNKWKENNSNNGTSTFVKLANETSLKAQWTTNDELKLANNNNNSSSGNQQSQLTKPTVTITKSYLASIGEGLLNLKCQIDYKIISGTISSFYIEIQDNINIINVEGIAIKKWEVIEKDTASSTSSKKSKYNRIIQIQLDYGFDNSYSLLIDSEYSMKDTSGDLSIPSMICKSENEGYLITRQRGFLGVEARTNVEISDIGNQGLNIVDVRELPLELTKLARFPILLSYKFLEPDFQLELRVKRNKDCAVLVSICESAHFITTVSYSGKMIHQIILNIKNTQKQFLRVQVPFEYEVWSSVMDGSPIKASIDEINGGTLLIPILKSGIFNQNVPIKIEIVLLQQSIHKFNNSTLKGNFKFTIPKIDLPLRSVFSTVFLPDGTRCFNFKGNIKQVESFSSNPPSASNGTNRQPQQPVSRRQSESKSKSSFLSSAPLKRGVVPVYVEIPTTLNALFFEQILLSGDKELTFSFDYQLKEKENFRTINFSKLTRNSIFILSVITLPLALVFYKYYSLKHFSSTSPSTL